MKIDLITQEIAHRNYLKLKDLASAIAKANNTLPGYCTAPECKLFMSFADLASQLKKNDICIFIDDIPAEQLTEYEIAPGQCIICKICRSNVKVVTVENKILLIKFFDGVVESFSYVEDLGLWKFLDKNISINVPSTSAN